MKRTFLWVLVVVLCVTACNHKPQNPETAVVSDTASIVSGNPNEIIDSVMLAECTVYSIKHAFSDSLAQDSFVLELPAGNVMTNQFYLRIFKSDGEMIYNDSAQA